MVGVVVVAVVGFREETGMFLNTNLGVFAFSESILEFGFFWNGVRDKVSQSCKLSGVNGLFVSEVW